MSVPDPAVQQLLDRAAISEVLYRYASSIDTADFSAVRRLFADDAVARFGDHEWLQGGDTIVDWIAGNSAVAAWQHHLQSVYHIEIDGDTASSLTYHTSHRIKQNEPDTALVIVARYHDELLRIEGEWKIARRVMEIGWRDTRQR